MPCVIRGFHNRRVWVDAICINQEDIGEKNYQIPLMGCLPLVSITFDNYLLRDNLNKCEAAVQAYEKRANADRKE